MSERDLILVGGIVYLLRGRKGETTDPGLRHSPTTNVGRIGLSYTGPTTTANQITDIENEVIGERPRRHARLRTDARANCRTVNPNEPETRTDLMSKALCLIRRYERGLVRRPHAQLSASSGPHSWAQKVWCPHETESCAYRQP